MPKPNPTTSDRPPTPSTHASLHLLVGDGRMPVVSAEAGSITGVDMVWARVEVDTLDAEPKRTRHAARFTVSGPRADVKRLIVDMAAAVAGAELPSKGEE
jgi:hypothetical protein